MGDSPNSLLIEKDWLFQFFISSKNRIYRHLLLIVLINLVLFNSKGIFPEPVLTYSRFVLLAVILLLFYINMYVLVPRFFFNNRYTAYALYIGITIAIVSLGYTTAWKILEPYKIDPGSKPVNLLTLSFVTLILVSASAAIKLFQRSVRDSLRINELEKTTMRSEMEQLKNQINPHFLFNMLNNANVLIQKEPLKASQVLMKLSDLLRYQLYDSARPRVLLTAEIHFLEDLLNLEQIRRDNFECLVSKQGELSGVQIAPLLLITFVENAIKHNIDPEERSYVHLYFDVRHNALHFECVNSKPRLVSTKKEVGGLGLSNVKRRLELIYAAQHRLQVDDTPDTYRVYLTINV